MRDIPEARAIKKITEQTTQKTNPVGCRKAKKKLIKYIAATAEKGKTSIKLYIYKVLSFPLSIFHCLLVSFIKRVIAVRGSLLAEWAKALQCPGNIKMNKRLLA